jgi:hypothetical protein
MPTRFFLDDLDRRHSVEEAHAFRDARDAQPTRTCPACLQWSAVGPPWAQVVQFQHHWPGCTGVASLSFHPDGSLASVTFRR